MEESNQRLVELINEINSQMLQESVRLSIRADKQNEEIDALEWRTNMILSKLDTIAIPVVPRKKVENVKSSTRPTLSKISCKSKFIKKAQQAKKRNMKKSSVLVDLSIIHETASEEIGRASCRERV